MLASENGRWLAVEDLLDTGHFDSDEITIKAYDRGLLQTELDYAPRNVATQVTANNSNGNDWLTWVSYYTEARTTLEIAAANAQLAFDQSTKAAKDTYRVGLADRQQALQNSSGARLASMLANLFTAGPSAMGDYRTRQ